jgi:hypothetical protein
MRLTSRHRWAAADRNRSTQRQNGGGGLSEHGRPATPPGPGQVTSRRGGKPPPKPTEATLGLHASAKLGERLIAEIRGLDSAEEAAEWVRQSLSEKNRLRAPDAAQVEAVFEAQLARLTAFGGPEVDVREASLVERSAAQVLKADPQSDDSTDPTRQTTIDKSALTFPEPRRLRDRHHIRLVMGRPCLVCGRLPSDPHHLRFAQSRALSRRVSDEFTVPLCRGHHRALHRHGDEAAWWARLGIDVLENCTRAVARIASASGCAHGWLAGAFCARQSAHRKYVRRTAVMPCSKAKHDLFGSFSGGRRLGGMPLASQRTPIGSQTAPLTRHWFDRRLSHPLGGQFGRPTMIVFGAALSRRQ